MVADSSDARIPGARVAIQNAGGKFELETSDIGEFAVEVPAGIYVLTVESPHYRKLKIDSFKIESGRTRTVSVRLEVGVMCDECFPFFYSLFSDGRPLETQNTPIIKTLSRP